MCVCVYVFFFVFQLDKEGVTFEMYSASGVVTLTTLSSNLFITFTVRLNDSCEAYIRLHMIPTIAAMTGCSPLYYILWVSWLERQPCCGQEKK